MRRLGLQTYIWPYDRSSVAIEKIEPKQLSRKYSYSDRIDISWKIQFSKANDGDSGGSLQGSSLEGGSLEGYG